MTLAQCILRALSRQGVKRIFGVPGGGSSLALIDAAAQSQIEFILTRTETAAAIMAAVTGELGTAPGVVLTGIGPGAASAVNGVAYASLERSPLLIFTDGPASSLHQHFDQSALFSPISKASLDIRAEHAEADIQTAMATALNSPQGPVHINLSAENASTVVPTQDYQYSEALSDEMDCSDIEQARQLIQKSRRPMIIAGLDARRGKAADGLQLLAKDLACPVLLSYKAKGVLADSDPHMAGLFTGARNEANFLEHADLLIFYGFDPIEIIPGPWRCKAPVLNLCRSTKFPLPVSPQCEICGPLETSVTQLLCEQSDSQYEIDWKHNEIAQLKQAMSDLLILKGDGHTVATVMDDLIKTAPADSRLCVDAGAHMFSAMSLWPAHHPYDVLKSNGLSTMGFALPAGIASSLQHADKTVVALTGDGGMLMCLSELTTAVEHGCRIVIVVINDAALSLIDIKQQRQQQTSSGVRYAAVDFAETARALGCTAWRIEPNQDLAPILSEAFNCDGPALLDVRVDASGYMDQLEALRG